jgi:hypothetical protein
MPTKTEGLKRNKNKMVCPTKAFFPFPMAIFQSFKISVFCQVFAFLQLMQRIFVKKAVLICQISATGSRTFKKY